MGWLGSLLYVVLVSPYDGMAVEERHLYWCKYLQLMFPYYWQWQLLTAVEARSVKGAREGKLPNLDEYMGTAVLPNFDK
jgi:hypothetical protein